MTYLGICAGKNRSGPSPCRDRHPGLCQGIRNCRRNPFGKWAAKQGLVSNHVSLFRTRRANASRQAWVE